MSVGSLIDSCFASFSFLAIGGQRAYRHGEDEAGLF